MRPSGSIGHISAPCHRSPSRDLIPRSPGGTQCRLQSSEGDDVLRGAPIEWEPSSCEFFIDGRSIGKSTGHTPTPRFGRLPERDRAEQHLPGSCCGGEGLHRQVQGLEVHRLSDVPNYEGEPDEDEEPQDGPMPMTRSGRKRMKVIVYEDEAGGSLGSSSLRTARSSPTPPRATGTRATR